mmetsp:Transcript_73582/g.203139  ORF Transcript_73582/g.203139 Transcript_73582/m.203139 type:complete len:212 (-) Transcript_73582:434-1069(-)
MSSGRGGPPSWPTTRMLVRAILWGSGGRSLQLPLGGSPFSSSKLPRMMRLTLDCLRKAAKLPCSSFSSLLAGCPCSGVPSVSTELNGRDESQSESVHLVLTALHVGKEAAAGSAPNMSMPGMTHAVSYMLSCRLYLAQATSVLKSSLARPASTQPCCFAASAPAQQSRTRSTGASAGVSRRVQEQGKVAQASFLPRQLTTWAADQPCRKMT